MDRNFQSHQTDELGVALFWSETQKGQMFRDDGGFGSDVTSVNLNDSRLNPVLSPVHCFVLYLTAPERKSHTLFP